MAGNESFEQIAAAGRGQSFLIELWLFLRQQKKYWMMPIVAVLLLLGFLIFLSGTAAAPFIYTIF